MRRTAFIVIILLATTAAFAQFPQMDKMREKMDASEKASAEKERRDREEAANRPAYPPARMNIDVQMVLTTTEKKNFAEAKPVAVSKIADGDPLWLYVKFNGVLDRYVYRIKTPDGAEQYVLFVEIGPQGDVTAKNHYILHFDKDDLKLPELKISLSPGAAGHIRAMPVFLRNVVNMRPGQWNNELRLTDRPSLPRGATDHLAKIPVTYDLAKGVVKYPKMLPDYTSNVLRGTTDAAKTPLVSKFDDQGLRTEIQARLDAEGIHPATLYFAGDGWSEFSDQPLFIRQSRNIFAAFTYTKGSECLYGIAEVVQTYDGMTDTYGNSVITLQKDIATPCVVAR